MMEAARQFERALPGGHLEPLTAAQLTPCIGCRRALVKTEHPTFSRFVIKRGGLGHRAAVLGGEFAGADPARIIETFEPVNICHSCMQTLRVIDVLLAVIAEQGGDATHLSTEDHQL